VETKFEEQHAYDPEKPKKLLDQAGYPGVGSKNRFKMDPSAGDQFRSP